LTKVNSLETVSVNNDGVDCRLMVVRMYSRCGLQRMEQLWQLFC